MRTEISTGDKSNRILSKSESSPVSDAVGRTSENMEFVYPNLLYKELIALMVVLLLLTVASIFINAPLLDIANPFKTENPAKAPWYFVGLQELLVYFDPWLAGVVLPSLILIGLMLIPYLDSNPEGVGKYSFAERKFAIVNFMVGFVLWWVLIFIGWYLRGPNWQFYGLGESWQYQKPAAEALRNMSLIGGGIFLVAYVVVGLILPKMLWKNFFNGWSTKKYIVVMGFCLLMYGVLIKMTLRIFFNIKYLLVTPWFNI